MQTSSKTVKKNVSTILLYIIVALLFIGNVFGFVNLFTDPDAFVAKFPSLTPFSVQLLTYIPVLNMISLVGIWFFKKWGVWLAIAGYGIITFVDIYVPIVYHLILSSCSSAVLFYLIYRNWKKFS